MSAATSDVVVIGGGLAGCSAAIALAGRGLRVVVLESARGPREKVCGEFLSPESAQLLDRLGALERVRACHPPTIDRVCITTPDGARWESALPGSGFGLSRRAFDALLIDRARESGADVREGTTVTAVRGDLDAGLTVEARSGGAASTFSARVVIGAHGKRSLVDRALGRAFLDQPDGFVGLKAYFRGPSTGAAVALHTFDGGYCGLSAIEEGRVNLCLLVRQATFRRFGGVDSFIGWMSAQNPALGGWLARADRVSDWLSIAQVSFAPKSPVERDLLMAGDSAGLIAPLAGDGMSMALESGWLAAGWADDYLAGRVTADDLRRGYAAAWRRAFDPRLRLGRVLQTVMLRPRLLAPGLRLASALPALGRFFVTQTRAPLATQG